MRNNTQEIADAITAQTEGRMALFRGLSLSEQGAVLETLPTPVQQDILDSLHTDEAVDLLDQLDLQHAESILAQMKNTERRARIATLLKGALRDKAEYFLRFHPKAALTLLNFDYLFLSHTTTILRTADEIDTHRKKTGKFPEILVHKNGTLIGGVPLGVLVREDNEEQLERYIVPTKTISYQADIHEIVSTFKSSAHDKVVVLDKDQSVIGVIYSDDALKLLNEEPSEALYDFAGVEESERPFDSVARKVRHRYKWLIINLATGFLAASVVGLFQNTVDQIVLLAIYMPIIAGMGGNAGTQTLAVMVRGITMGEVGFRNGLPVIFREVGAGVVNGFLNGAIVALVATFWNKNPLFGLIVGLAMVINLIVAGFFGALIPLVMKNLGKDPATSATIFITTATDVFGFFVFLGLATIFLV